MSLEAQGIMYGQDTILKPAAFTPDQFAFLWWMEQDVAANGTKPLPVEALAWNVLAKSVKDEYTNTFAAVFYRLLQKGVLEES
jgi:hypothetical protein